MTPDWRPPPRLRLRPRIKCARCGEQVSELGGFTFAHASWGRGTHFCSIRCMLQELAPISPMTEQEFIEMTRIRARMEPRGRRDPGPLWGPEWHLRGDHEYRGRYGRDYDPRRDPESRENRDREERERRRRGGWR